MSEFPAAVVSRRRCLVRLSEIQELLFFALGVEVAVLAELEEEMEWLEAAVVEEPLALKIRTSS